MTCVLSHEEACIFCFSSTIACLPTCNNKVIDMVTFLFELSREQELTNYS
jgi:hypothetical protein